MAATTGTEKHVKWKNDADEVVSREDNITVAANEMPEYRESL
jgi:hypothetical protein